MTGQEENKKGNLLHAGAQAHRVLDLQTMNLLREVKFRTSWHFSKTKLK